MMQSGHPIDLAGWRRREHFELYRRARQPFFSVTVDVDVTSLWQRCRGTPGASFTLAGLFALVRAINASEPLRLRLRGETVWLHDHIGVGTTILRPDETFAFARFDPASTYAEFQRLGTAEIQRARMSTRLDVDLKEDDVLYHSFLPWLRFTAFTNVVYEGDSIPRVVFGKVSAAGSGFQMPVAVEVHHALVDGLDVARFIAALEMELNAVDL